MRDPIIRLFHDTASGLASNGADYTVPELGGAIPSIGDMIVEPGVTTGLSREVPENRDVYTVTERYFIPSATGTPLIALVVQVRRGEHREVDVLGG